MDSKTLVARNKGYKHMLFYKKSVVIYDLTHLFCSRYIDTKDRTHDQMVQAARSAKQNIVEGYVDGATSVEICLKLLNIARGSLMELLEDYEDYIRTRGLKRWEPVSAEHLAMKKLSRERLDPETYIKIAETRNDETIANTAIILIEDAENLLYRYIVRKSADFLKQGGFRERLTHERIKARKG